MLDLILLLLIVIFLFLNVYYYSNRKPKYPRGTIIKYTILHQEVGSNTSSYYYNFHHPLDGRVGPQEVWDFIESDRKSRSTETKEAVVIDFKVYKPFTAAINRM